MTNKTKTLDTLVEDIYNKIGVLADGEHIDLDPETIDQFGESMKDILYKWSHPEPRGDTTLRMSNIGRKPTTTLVRYEVRRYPGKDATFFVH
jgi:hypothetical protein